MALVKRKDSEKYYVELVVDGKRVRRSTGTTNKRKAQRIHDAFRQKLRLEELGITEPDVEVVSVGEYSKEYLATHSALKRSYKSDVNRMKLVTEYFAGRNLHSITRQDVDRFRAWLLQQDSRGTRTKGKLSPATANRVLSLLRHLLATAEQSGLIRSNPFRGVKLMREQRKTRVLSKDEEEKLLAVCNPPLKQFVIVALQTAARAGELTGLRWRDVNSNDRTVRFQETKTGKSRVVPLNQRAMAALAELPKGRASDLVFQIRNNLNRNMKAAVRRAGLPEDISPHVFRHTTLSRLAAKGVDVRSLQEISGHQGPAMLLRYLHSPRAASAVALLDEDTDPPQNAPHKPNGSDKD